MGIKTTGPGTARKRKTTPERVDLSLPKKRVRRSDSGSRMAADKSHEKVASQDQAAVPGSGSRNHANLVKQILIACGSRSDCRIWPNNTGKARAFDHDGVISFGLVGSSDILGITSDGRFLAIEVKTGNAVQSQVQRKFMIMINEFFGRYFLVHSVAEAQEYLDMCMLEPIEELR